MAGVIWYFQFFFYSMGQTRMGKYDFSSWTLHMASIVIFATLWGLFLKEWRGTSRRTKSSSPRPFPSRQFNRSSRLRQLPKGQRNPHHCHQHAIAGPKFVNPTRAQLSGEPALSEVEWDLLSQQSFPIRTRTAKIRTQFLPNNSLQT